MRGKTGGSFFPRSKLADGDTQAGEDIAAEMQGAAEDGRARPVERVEGVGEGGVRGWNAGCDVRELGFEFGGGLAGTG